MGASQIVGGNMERTERILLKLLDVRNWACGCALWSRTKDFRLALISIALSAENLEIGTTKSDGDRMAAAGDGGRDVSAGEDCGDDPFGSAPLIEARLVFEVPATGLR